MVSGLRRAGCDGRGQTRAKCCPSQIAPRTNRTHDADTDGEDHAEEGGVFDEGRAAVVLMEVAEEGYDVAHDL